MIFVIEKAWNWNNITSTHWNEPSEDIYYYLHLWSEKRSKKLLDLGSGIGRHSLLFAKNGFDVTAFDFSKEGLDKIENFADQLNLEIDLVNGNMNRLPFASQSFDFVVAYNSIYHTDYEGLIRTIYEIRRVLKANGEAFVTMLSKNDKSFIDGSGSLIAENTLMKKEEDGSILPHFFVDEEYIYKLFKSFHIISLKQIEEFHEDKTFFHYAIHLRKGDA